MRQTVPTLAAAGFPSFWKRSLDAFKSRSQFALKLEALEEPKATLPIWDFTTPDGAETCTEMSDGDIGGFSKAHIDHSPSSERGPPHLRFHGEISNRLPLNDKNVERTGYAAWRTLDRPATVFGKQLWDVSQYSFLALRVKSDGRKYKVNVQTESIVPTDLHQYRLYTRRPGEWETVLIKWRDFVRTNHGVITEPQSEMMKDKIRTIGIGLTDRIAGPFEMCISRVWATNGLTADEIREYGLAEPTYVPRDGKGP